MIRIEILFDRQSTKNLKSGTLQALQNEIEQRLKPHYPEIWLRIDQGSAPSVSVTGARNDKDKERILSLLEEIWQDTGTSLSLRSTVSSPSNDCCCAHARHWSRFQTARSSAHCIRKTSVFLVLSLT